ncbi:MAG TPA: hypothetical protein VMB80_02750 [Candidatus Acidoferrum sp.]|nr:hypothetical protein [Candidatus Acidoferrum sp.]
MKTKITLVLVVVTALAVGFVAGKFQASFPWKEHLTSYTFERDAYSASCYTRVLTLWRSGHEDDARDSLEKFLDLSLASLQNIPARAEVDGVRDAILQARDYRAKYPHTSGIAEIDNRVSRTFALLPK